MPPKNAPSIITSHNQKSVRLMNVKVFQDLDIKLIEFAYCISLSTLV